MSSSNEIKSTKGLLDVCEKYEKIIVSGPNRSGTTFLTRQLSEQLNYVSIYLEDFYIHDEDVFIEIINSPGRKVIQCPTMCHLLHELDVNGLLTIFLRRDLKDIHASEDRIHWADQKNYMRGVHMNEEVFEKSKYLKSNIPNIDFYDPIGKIKIDTWDNYQKDKIENKIELSFSQMESFFPEAWVDKKERMDFHPRQTQLDSDEDLLVNKNYQLFSTSSEDHFCQIFVDSGKGYSESNSIRKRIFSGLNKIVFDLSNFKDIKNLRFDPINDYAIIELIRIDAIYENGHSKSIEVINHNGYELKSDIDKLVFDHKDANIFLSNIDANVKAILVHFNLDKLESTLKFLYEAEKEKKPEIKKTASAVVSDTIANPIQSNSNDILLKKINGKLNLQAGELEYIKSLISKIKPGNKEQPVFTENNNAITDTDLAKLLDKEKDIQKKLNSIESTIVDKQITIKSLLDMTGVEIKTALDKINATFESNEQNKLLVEKYRKINISLDKEILILKHKMEEQNKTQKNKLLEIAKLSKQLETIHADNIRLDQELRLIRESNKNISSEIKKHVKSDLKKALVIENLKKEIKKTRRELQQLLVKHTQLIDANAILKKDLQSKQNLIIRYEKLQHELNFLSSFIE